MLAEFVAIETSEDASLRPATHRIVIPSAEDESWESVGELRFDTDDKLVSSATILVGRKFFDEVAIDSGDDPQSLLIEVSALIEVIVYQFRTVTTQSFADVVDLVFDFSGALPVQRLIWRPDINLITQKDAR